MNIARRLLAIASILLFLLIVANVRGDAENTTRRVGLHASSTTAFPGHTFVVEAVGTEHVRGAGTDLFADAIGVYCDLHFDSVQVEEDGNTAVLVGKVVDAATPTDLGAFVKITAHTDGRVNFVFQNLPGTGVAATVVDFTGATVSIVNF
jgi:hypothetical protein